MWWFAPDVGALPSQKNSCPRGIFMSYAVQNWVSTEAALWVKTNCQWVRSEKDSKSDSTWAQFNSWSGLNVWRGIRLVFSWFESLTQSEPADGVTLYCNVNLKCTRILFNRNFVFKKRYLKPTVVSNVQYVEFNWKHYKINLIYQHNVKKQPFCHHSMYTLPCRDSTGVSMLTY